MRRAFPRTLAALAALFVFATAALAQNFDAGSEQQLVQLVNAERAKSGLPPLSVDERLTKVAREHSDTMAEKNALSHQFGGEPGVKLRIAATTLRFNYSGENVAYDTNAERAHEGLMNSPPHRANILKPEFNAIGIGVVRKGNVIYVTQDFARRLPEVSISQAEEQIATAFARLRQSAGASVPPRKPAPELRNAACEMARDDRLNPRAVQGITDVHSVIVYTATEVDKLPSSAQQLKTENASAYSVGVCSARSASYPNAVYWVALVTYF